MQVLALVVTAFLTTLEISSAQVSTSSPPTTKSDFCKTEDGHVLAAGTQLLVPLNGGCIIYKCDENGHLSWIYGDCLPPMCVDPKMDPSGCCKNCPNGSNCRLPNGDVMPATEERVVGNRLCHCPPQVERFESWSEEHYTAICEGSTTTITTTTPTPPPLCHGLDGRVFDWLQPGESKKQGCEVCNCSTDYIVRCTHVHCARPKCADPVTPRGGCCPICPHGENCRLPTGRIIRKGQSVQISGKTCSCFKPPEADCIPATAREILLAKLRKLQKRLKRVKKRLGKKGNIKRLRRLKSQLEKEILQIKERLG